MNYSYNNFTYALNDKGVALLKANRPRAKNAMNLEGWRELLDFVTRSQADPEIRIIILSGEGDAFIAGADIKEAADAPPSAALLGPASQVVSLLAACRTPVIAAINGPAFGGGFEIALACDIRLVSASAVMGLPEAGLGLIPGMGGTQRLCKLVGLGRAKDIVMGGRNIKGEEAQAIGLAMKCVPGESLLDEAMKVAERMLLKGPNALALIKRLMHAAYSTDDTTGLLLENLGFCALMGDEEMREGTAAFLEKRKPEFHG